MYASKTTVSVEKSQMEAKKVLMRYGATAFGIMENKDKAMLTFEIKTRRIVFRVPLPVQGKYESQNAHDQKVRSRWRALVLALKAKLECVDSGITTIEQEFLAHMAMPGGQVYGDVAIPMIDEAILAGGLPPLLGPGQ